MSLARATARGVVWAFVATALSKLAWLGALAVLARLLAPEQFGLFAFGLVFLTYVETVGDLGTGMALIHWPRRVEAAAHVTFYLNLAMGLVWFTLAQLAAPAVASFFRNPEGEPLIRVLAFSFLIRALGNTHDALCQKELRFKARVIPETTLTLTKGLVAVALAFAGFGVWSLVWGQLAGLVLQVAALWIVVPWRPSGAPPSRGWGDLVRPMLAYGQGIIVVNVLAAVVHHGDLVVVGRMLGTTVLGFYQMATKVPEATVTVAVWVSSRVLFAAFSRVHASGRGLGRAFVASLRYMSLLTVPAAAGLVMVAEPLVRTAFGEEWLPTVPILQGIAIYIGLRSLGTQAGDVLKATGRTGVLAVLAVAKAVVLVPALIQAGRHDAVAVAGTLAAVAGLFTLVNLGVISKLASVPAGRMAAAFVPAFAGGAVMVAALAAWQEWGADLLGPSVPPALELAVRVVLGAAVYAGTVLLVAPGLVAEVRGVLAGRGEPGSAVASGEGA